MNCANETPIRQKRAGVIRNVAAVLSLAFVVITSQALASDTSESDSPPQNNNEQAAYNKCFYNKGFSEALAELIHIEVLMKYVDYLDYPAFISSLNKYFKNPNADNDQTSNTTSGLSGISGESMAETKKIADAILRKLSLQTGENSCDGNSCLAISEALGVMIYDRIIRTHKSHIDSHAFYETMDKLREDLYQKTDDRENNSESWIDYEGTLSIKKSVAEDSLRSWEQMNRIFDANNDFIEAYRKKFDYQETTLGLLYRDRDDEDQIFTNSCMKMRNTQAPASGEQGTWICRKHEIIDRNTKCSIATSSDFTGIKIDDKAIRVDFYKHHGALKQFFTGQSVSDVDPVWHEVLDILSENTSKERIIEFLIPASLISNGPGQSVGSTAENLWFLATKLPDTAESDENSSETMDSIADNESSDTTSSQ